MRTAASEYLSNTQRMSRLGATFGALVHEQIEAVRRYLDDETSLQSSELGSIAELAVRIVERSAEWLEVGEVASLALEMREALTLLPELRPAQRSEIIAQCRVALDAEERLLEGLRADGFSALIEHAGIVSDAVDGLRANRSQARTQEMNSARGVIDEATPDVGSYENLLALTFEIKNSLVHQNERIGAMGETVGGTLEAAQAALTEWEGVHKAVERQRVTRAGKSDDTPGPLEGKSLIIHQRLQDTASGLRTLSYELNQLLGLQYSLERRARDLDEHLLWEFLDPLDRYRDELYGAVARASAAGRRMTLAVQTSGVGFEPDIGAILLPLLLRLLESMEPVSQAEDPVEVRLTAAREGLEARIGLEGPVRFEETAMGLLENALEDLGGFVAVRETPGEGSALRLQFPMARSLRSFLIVEAGGRRIALPWSAVERIHASVEDTAWAAGEKPGPIHSLARLFGGEDSMPESTPASTANQSTSKPGTAADGRPLAVLRCGRGSAAVSFDRIVWRENARLKPLPGRLYPVDEVLGGIVAPDSSITLVLNPGGLLRRALRSPEHSWSGA